MKASITQDLIRSLGHQDVTVFDTQQPGLQLRLRASGRHSYRVQLGRGAFLTLGTAKVLKPAEARDLALGHLAAKKKGQDPIAERRAEKAPKAATFDAFLKDTYEPWAKTHLKSLASTIAPLWLQFSPIFGSKPLAEIVPFAVEAWRVRRLKGGVSKATANKDLSALKACLSRAVEWGLLADHPLRKVKPSKQDRGGVVRYLSPTEETALRAQLVKRDAARIDARDSANDWRRQRGYPELPHLGTYADHLTPIVLLALNTGLRRGELLGLEWGDVDLARAILTVRGEGAKSGKTRYLPLNTEAVNGLKAWQDQATGDLVFPGDDGGKMFSLKTAWLKVAHDAGLKVFRFHDLRHSFASRLVQSGVDLNTVRELLGHSDFSLTLRYAHLAAENKAAAVAKLNVR
jgi:integrase